MASSGELGHAIDAIKWGTDYLIKAHPQPYVLYGEVGDGNTDQYRWQRTEIAAAMAAASIVFRRYDRAYSAELLKTCLPGYGSKYNTIFPSF